MATLSSPCDIGHSARWSPRSRKQGRPTQCRGGISDRYIPWLPGRSHTVDRHRRRPCDEAPETSPALRRRKLGTPIDPLRFASCGTPRSVMFSKARRHGPARLPPRRKTRCSACERRPWSSAAAGTRPDRSGCARSVSQDGHALTAAAAASQRRQRTPAGFRRSFRECAGYRTARRLRDRPWDR